MIQQVPDGSTRALNNMGGFHDKQIGKVVVVVVRDVYNYSRENSVAAHGSLYQ